MSSDSAGAVLLLQTAVTALSDSDIEALSATEQLDLPRVLHPLVCRMEAQRTLVSRGEIALPVARGADLRPAPENVQVGP